MQCELPKRIKCMTVLKNCVIHQVHAKQADRTQWPWASCGKRGKKGHRQVWLTIATIRMKTSVGVHSPQLLNCRYIMCITHQQCTMSSYTALGHPGVGGWRKPGLDFSSWTTYKMYTASHAFRKGTWSGHLQLDTSTHIPLTNAVQHMYSLTASYSASDSQ